MAENGKIFSGRVESGQTVQLSCECGCELGDMDLTYGGEFTCSACGQVHIFSVVNSEKRQCSLAHHSELPTDK